MERVRFDLNFSDFQAQPFNLDTSELRPVFKTLKELSGMSWLEVYADHGLKWEEIKAMKGRYTIRLSRQCRAVVVREGEFMCFRGIHIDHDVRIARSKSLQGHKKASSRNASALPGACWT